MSTHLREAWRKTATTFLTLYHGTIDKHVPAIKANGLVPPVPTAKWYMLTSSIEQAARYTPSGDRSVVLEFRVPADLVWRSGSDNAVLWPGDPHGVYGFEATAYAVKGVLPPEYLVAVHPVVDRQVKTALPTWRGFQADEEPFWTQYDAVIATQMRGRQRYYEVWTYGQNFGSFPRLDDAKANLERIYGPLDWQRITMDKVDVEHYYFGWTTEFTDPLTIYIVPKLPTLGASADKKISQNERVAKSKFAASTPEAIRHGVAGQVVMLPTEWVFSKQQQPFWETLEGRTYEERVALREDIKANGIQVPLELGQPRPGVYQLDEGHQRVNIAKALGLPEVPVLLGPGFPLSVRLP